MKKIIIGVAVLLELLYGCGTRAANTDSLLAAAVTLPKPYVVLNITSTDCIACRSAGMAVLKALAGEEYKNKIVIVTDDKGMGPYFKTNSNIYGKYRVIYDRCLSAALSIGPASSVALVQASGVSRYLFSNVDKDTLTYMANVLNVMVPYSRFSIPDTLLSAASSIQVTDSNVLLTNDRVQVGVWYDRIAQSMRYLQPGITDQAADAIYSLFRETGVKGLNPAQTVRKVLNSIGMSMVTICKPDIRSGTALFRLFTMHADTTITGNDTNIRQQIYNPNLVAGGLKAGADPFDMGAYSSVVPIDSIRFDGKRYISITNMGYEAGDGYFLFPFANYENSRKMDLQGKQVSVTTDLCIALMGMGNHKANLLRAWPVKGYDAMNASQVYFRFSGQGRPVIINNSQSKVSFPEVDLSIPFSRVNDGRDTVAYLYEAAINDSIIKFAALTTNKSTVAGYFDFLHNTTVLKKLNDSYNYFCFNKSELLCFKKQEDDPQWQVFLYRLP